MMPQPVRLFHMTAIDNLVDILRLGAIISKSSLDAQGISYQNIAHTPIQTTRSAKLVPHPPGGYIHDYVPFYFAPRSPMLLAIHHGNVAGCMKKQDDIIHFETTVERISAQNAEFVFYDRNAALSYSKAHTDLKQLSTQIAWDLITETPQLDGFCKYFQDNPRIEKYVDRKAQRMAEFLVKDRVGLALMTRIGVINEAKAKVVREYLEATGIDLRVEVKPEWYFLGQ